MCSEDSAENKTGADPLPHRASRSRPEAMAHVLGRASQDAPLGGGEADRAGHHVGLLLPGIFERP